MKKIFKWLLVLIAFFAVILTTVLYKPGLIRGPLERYLSTVSGYPVTLHGDLEIDTGRITTLDVRNITVSAPDRDRQTNIIELGQLRLNLVSRSLFSDTVIIDHLLVDTLELNLETSSDGQHNWLSKTAPASDSEGNSEEGSEEDPGSQRVVIRHIKVNNSNIRHLNGKTGINHLFHVDSLEQRQGAGGMLDIDLSAKLNDRPVHYAGAIGPYENLLSGKDISFSGSGHFGQLAIQGKGLLDDLRNPVSPEFSFDLQGPDINEITAMLGTSDLGGGGVSLQAQGGQIDGMYEAGISGQIGDISLNAAASTSNLSDLDKLDLNMSINGPSLAAMTQVFGIEHWPDKPFKLTGSATRVGGTLDIRNLILNIGGTRMTLDALLSNFPSLDSSRVKLMVSGDDISLFHDLIGIKGLATGAFSLNGRIDASPDGLELVQVDMQTSLGQATVSGSLGPAPDYAGSKLRLQLDGPDAHALIAMFGIDALPEQAFNLNAQVELEKDGVHIDHGALLTIAEERLELGGYIAFNPGIKGSDLQAAASGQNFALLAQRLLGEVEVPQRPYQVQSRIRVMDNGIQLDNFKAEFESITLTADGLFKPVDQLLGSSLNYQLSGQDFSSLAILPLLGEKLDVFVPGQSYTATGIFSFERDAWKINGMKGKIGSTSLELDALLSHQDDLVGSNISFSVHGPDINHFLTGVIEGNLPPGEFRTSGRLQLSDGLFSIRDYRFETALAHANMDLDIGRPYSSGSVIDFNINVSGDDIRQVLPEIPLFNPAKQAFKLVTTGHVEGELVSMKQFDASIGNLQISVQGELGDQSDRPNANVHLSADSNDISTLGQLNDVPMPALALSLDADFKGDLDEFSARNLTLMLGQSQVKGVLDVSLAGEVPAIRLKATSDLLDLRPFLKKPDSASGKDARVESPPTPVKQRMIPPTPIPIDALDDVDLAISLRVAELRYATDSIRNLVLEIDQKKGKLDVHEVSYLAPRGELKSSLSIHPVNDTMASVKLDLQANGVVFNLAGLPDSSLEFIPAFDLMLNLSGEGGNLQEVAGSSNGVIYLGSKGGTIEGLDLSIFESFILDDILDLLVPKSEKPDDSEITCIATVLEVTDGLVKTDPAIAFTTDLITVITRGSLDLKTEKLNFNFNATPKKALNINASEMFQPYILIGGTLSSPNVGIDPGKALLHGGAAVGTMGISILAKGVLDRMGTVIPVCVQLLEKGMEKDQEN